MKYLKIISVIILFASCNQESKITLTEDSLIGNWSSLNNNTYQEYYFDNDDMYIYDTYDVNILQYKYVVKENSIYRYFVHPELKDQDYEYYEKIVGFDSLVINFKGRKIKKIKDSITLEMLINKKVDETLYYHSCTKRGGINVPK